MLKRRWEALKYDVLKIICYSKQYNLECFIGLAFVGREKNKRNRSLNTDYIMHAEMTSDINMGGLRVLTVPQVQGALGEVESGREGLTIIMSAVSLSVTISIMHPIHFTRIERSLCHS